MRQFGRLGAFCCGGVSAALLLLLGISLDYDSQIRVPIHAAHNKRRKECAQDNDGCGDRPKGTIDSEYGFRLAERLWLPQHIELAAS